MHQIGLTEHEDLLKDIESSNVPTVEQQAETDQIANGSKPNGGKHSKRLRAMHSMLQMRPEEQTLRRHLASVW